MEAREQAGNGTYALVVLVQVVGGLIWLGIVFGGMHSLVGPTAALVWTACGAFLWIRTALELNGETDAERLWVLAGRWYVEALVAPFALAFHALTAGASTPSDERVAALERRLTAVESELSTLRSPSPAEAPAPKPEPEPEPEPIPQPAAPSQSPAPRPWERELDLSDLLGARTLAWVGGLVTLLGIVLLFGLAVNRGWIGPVARVGIGALASALVFGGGLWLQRRYGTTHAALAAVGVGIAGGYATLLAAAALYHLLPAPAALVAAAAIAAVALATSLVWSSELVAGFGLIGAMLVPIAVVFDDGPTILGTAFVAFMLGATGAVGVIRRWIALLVAGAAASLPQIALLVLLADDGSARVTALAAVFATAYVTIGVALQLVRPRQRLDGFAASFAFGGTAVAGASALLLYDGTPRGIALLAAAAPLAAAGAFFFAAARDRDLGGFLAVLALALVAVAVASLLSGPTLAIAWSAEAAALAWLADRTREPRFQLAAFAYLALAGIHALAIDAQPRRLLEVSPHPAAGVAAVVAAAAAAAIAAFYARLEPSADEPAGAFAAVDAALDELAAAQRAVRVTLVSAAALLGLYAGAQAILELVAGVATDPDAGFAWGHVAVTAASATVAVGALAVGLRRRLRELELGALAWAAFVLVELGGFDFTQLPAEQRSYASLAVAAAALAFAVANRLLRPREDALDGVTIVASIVGAALAASAALVLVGGQGIGGNAEGAALLAVAGVYGATAVAVHSRDRDFATLLWAIALALGIGGSVDLLGGTWLVLAWAAAAVTVATLAAVVEEDRLVSGAVVLAGLAVAHALALDAPPSHLFVARQHPGTGLAALLLAAAATGWVARSEDGLEQSFTRFGLALAGAVTVYAASLGILESAEALGTASTNIDFQHGHTVVSAFWGALGLSALYVGLKQRSRPLRLGGFALFGVSLAKLFLYDLAALSSVTRALSFLAVGVVLLLGGFFYQRLAA